MKKLTRQQLYYIRKGIEEEYNNDIRIHSGIKHETADYYFRYTLILNGDVTDEYEINIVPDLLSLCYDFWKIYFIESPEAAFEMEAKRKEERIRHNEKIKNQIAEAISRTK